MQSEFEEGFDEGYKEGLSISKMNKEEINLAFNRMVDLEQENIKLKDCLEEIVRVNAMDYEYVRWAKEALESIRGES